MADVCTLYHGGESTPDVLGPVSATGQRTPVVWRAADELLTAPESIEEPAVVLVDRALLDHRIAALLALPGHIVVVAMDEASERELGDRVDMSSAGVGSACGRARLLTAATELAASRSTAARLMGEIDRARHEFHELSRIAMGLTIERDRTALLSLILTKGRELTDSDGGGLLLVRPDEHVPRIDVPGKPAVAYLYPVLYGFDSLPDLQPAPIRFAIDNTTTIGHAATIKQPIVVADAHALPMNSRFVASSEFERRHGYWARSMLVVPMMDHLDRVLGVLLLVNRKRHPSDIIRSKEDADRCVLPYTDREVRLARSLASQAAITIENARLYDQIEQILEGFVKASVAAIDQRDPTTAGHSLRVAALATGLAEAVGRSSGPYRDVRFTAKQMRELRYAALLHDFGKITVREDVLMKAKKLPLPLWERVRARFELIRSVMEAAHFEALAGIHCDDGGNQRATAALDSQLAAQVAELDRQWRVVQAANEPSMLDRAPAAELAKIARCTFIAPNGDEMVYLTPEELHFLQLQRGTLDESERAEIESHVEETYRFLTHIPWTEDLKNLVIYAYGHHEKLNGTGYPRKLRGDEIPIQTRIIALADVFDALTEPDRPYKPSVSPERALDIMERESEDGLFDRDLVKVLRDSKVYRRILDEDWHQFC